MTKRKFQLFDRVRATAPPIGLAKLPIIDYGVGVVTRVSRTGVLVYFASRGHELWTFSEYLEHADDEA